MKISKIEFENFRNFKGHGEILCSTDGKVTLIYGKNGDGKTTLHQLFQWIFYGQVHFNKTTTDRLYNLKYESEQSFGDTFEVMGCIDFEHDGAFYSLRRVYTYKKGIDGSQKIGEDVALNKRNDDYDWLRVDRPNDMVEKLLPSGLSEYFFFDGESMIADLRVKGRDSASKLRKALYSMFDLNVLEAAITHIGDTEKKTTVLGKLYLSKGTISSNSTISAIKTNIENAQAKKDRIEQEIQKCNEEKSIKQALTQSISEQIGSAKSKAEYERRRKQLKVQRDTFLRNATDTQSTFGDAVLDMFPPLLISKAIATAQDKIHLKAEESKLPHGLRKELITYLLSDDTATCICGSPLCQEQRNHIQSYLQMLPPHSYTQLYHNFSNTTKQWGRGYDKEKIEKYIISVLDNNEQASQCDTRIHELDEIEKQSPDVENLIVSRRKAEQDIVQLDARISELTPEKKKCEIYLQKQMRDFDQLTKETTVGERFARRIAIMEAVSAAFRQRLDDASLSYSKKLEEMIQSLIEEMLTSKRTVSVTPEFFVRVTDSFNDESKSEGQFAVVSFAYIGGILKMLQDEATHVQKEYPLILDGPFSKLDVDQRQNVVRMIPQFAPQVILFSKDDLHDVFDKENIGRVWTIVSNDEKNVAHVKEGYLWN